MKLYSFRGQTPRIHPSAYIFEDAVIIGDVEIGAHVSVWPGVVIRGDKAPIVIEPGSNIQERAVLHADPGFALSIGEDVTVGHGVILHGCTIGRNSVIGIGAVVLNGAVIGRNCLIAANALVTEKMQVPDGAVVMGSPGRVQRILDEHQRTTIARNALHYIANGRLFRERLQELGNE